jgi:hypothetical protein
MLQWGRFASVDTPVESSSVIERIYLNSFDAAAAKKEQKRQRTNISARKK